MAEIPSTTGFSAQGWIEGVYASREADIATAAGQDLLGARMNADARGTFFQEQLDAQHAADPGVVAKNRLLGILAELADSRGYHVGDLLALLDRQACEIEPGEETRHRQFMGLWDMLVAVAKDEQLVEALRKQQMTLRDTEQG